MVQYRIKILKRMIAESYDLVSDSPTKRIYSAVKKIPRGCVATYGQIAELAGDRKMARAVGNALHKNPDPEKYSVLQGCEFQGELSGSLRSEEQENRQNCLKLTE